MKCLRNRVRVWNNGLARADVCINYSLIWRFFSSNHYVLTFKIQSSWTQPYGCLLFQKAYHHGLCVCVSLFKNMSKMRDEHWNNDILLDLSRSSFTKLRPAKCMCLRSFSSEFSPKTTWSEGGDTTCSYFRCLLFQKVWSLFSCFRDFAFSKIN